MKRGMLIYSVLYIVIAGCTEPYNPKLSESSVNVLVVDGLINSTDSTAQVKLSRAVSVASTSNYPAETGATVVIEEQGGAAVTLTESGQGVYSTRFVSVVQKQYRLSIVTSDGRKYSSDYVTASQAPAIDTVFWKPGDDGISIVANTHDPANQTRYYRWTFNETWEYQTPYSPNLIVHNGQVVPYIPPISLHTCWRTAPSQTILIYSTKAFSEDIVSEFPVTYVLANSQQLSKRYSIEVKQQAISEDEYNFWQQLQATTQNLGGIFDPLPTQVIGNIHYEGDATQLVLGYFTAGAFTTKRVFVDRDDLPLSLKRQLDLNRCTLDSIPINKLGLHGEGTLFVSSYGSPFPLGYLYATAGCIDCRIQGGTIIKPSFWK